MFVIYWTLNAPYTFLQIRPSVSVEGIPAVSLSEPKLWFSSGCDHVMKAGTSCEKSLLVFIWLTH